MIRLTRYNGSQAEAWDAFVASAKNGVFLFARGYMDYHADRFADHSLLVWNGDKLVAVIPANETQGMLASHGGLTFGGVVCDRRMRTSLMLEIFAALRAYLADAGLRGMLYKATPHIYHRVPAEEDLYALFRNGARLVRRDVSSTIDLRDRVPFTKGRKWSTGKALASGLEVVESREVGAFMELEAAHLQAKYGVAPTHSSAEMELLASRFPDNIRLFVARLGARTLGGVLVYQSAMVAHAQYIAATDEGRALGSLDAIMRHLLETTYAQGPAWFDFGISTERGGTVLNAGLIENKESYGARATVHDFYELDAA